MLAENQQLFNTYRGKNENDPVYTAWRQNETHDMIGRTQEAHDSGSKWCKRNIEEAHDTQGRQDSFVRGWIVWDKRNTRQDSFDSGWMEWYYRNTRQEYFETRNTSYDSFGTRSIQDRICVLQKDFNDTWRVQVNVLKMQKGNKERVTNTRRSHRRPKS